MISLPCWTLRVGPDGAVVAQHPHGTVAQPLGHWPDVELQGVAGGQLQQLGPASLGQPGRVGGERLGAQWVGLGVVVHAHPPGRPTSKASGRGTVTCRGPDQARFALVSLTAFRCWRLGLDGAPCHRATGQARRQAAKRRRRAGIPDTDGCSTTLRRAFLLQAVERTIGRRAGGPLVRVVGSMEINRPAGQVWAYVADYANDPSWRAAVTQMRQSVGAASQPG
jgi:hypothetical protein